jgi:hypothetical protein
MAMNYEELDQRTRDYMLAEFDSEERSARPYRSKALSSIGLECFPDFMREAIQSGNEETLCLALNFPEHWEPFEQYVRDGIARPRRRNIFQSAQRLALTEFSTWYVRGLAKRLLDEGVEKCQIYRGETPKWEMGECSAHEGQVVAVLDIYKGHRIRYWPEPGDPNGFSIPFGPGCHHIIRRLRG